MGGGNTDAVAGIGGCDNGGNGDSPFGIGGWRHRLIQEWRASMD